MRGRIERISTRQIQGWAYADEQPTKRVHVVARLKGRIIGSTIADKFRPDLEAARLGDGCCSFQLEVEPFRNVLSVLANGELSVLMGLGSDSDGDEGTYVEIEHARHILSTQTLTSADELFGDVRLEQLLEYIRLLSKNYSRSSNNVEFCLDILNYSRAYFPDSARGEAFYELGKDLSAATQMRHSHRFYEAKLRRITQAGRGLSVPPVHYSVKPAWGSSSSYASLSDLVESGQHFHIELQTSQFIDGDRQLSFLSRVGFFSEDQPALKQADATRIRALIFHVNGFPDQHWRVSRNGKPRYVFERLYLLDFEQLRCAVDNGSIIILDMSAEGPAARHPWVDLFNSAIIDLGVPSSHVLLINQNLAFSSSADKSGFKAAVGHAHFYMKKGLDSLSRQYTSDRQISDYVSFVMNYRKQQNLPKKYICLNSTPRWHRWAIVLSLFYHGRIAEGYVSFPGISNLKLATQTPHALEMPAIKNRDVYLACLPDFLKLCPLTIDEGPQSGRLLDYVFPTHFLADSLIHIVTETEMSDGSVRRITEKILKPIVGLQPFIIVGNPGSLDVLRQLGFRTFDSILDESYDRALDVLNRFETIDSALLSLLLHDVESIRARLESALEILVHNFVHLVRVAPVLFGRGVENRLRVALAEMHATIGLN